MPVETQCLRLTDVKTNAQNLPFKSIKFTDCFVVPPRNDTFFLAKDLRVIFARLDNFFLRKTKGSFAKVQRMEYCQKRH
jgi:hypothetical protein